MQGSRVTEEWAVLPAFMALSLWEKRLTNPVERETLMDPTYWWKRGPEGA